MLMKVKVVNIGLFMMKKEMNFMEVMKIVNLTFQRLQDFSVTQLTGQKIKAFQIVSFKSGNCSVLVAGNTEPGL